MTQDERWMVNYNEVWNFIEMSRRNLSKYDLEERWLYTWMKYNRKQMNAGKMKAERVEKFKKLLEMTELYRRKNQYE